MRIIEEIANHIVGEPFLECKRKVQEFMKKNYRYLWYEFEIALDSRRCVIKIRYYSDMYTIENEEATIIL